MCGLLCISINPKNTIRPIGKSVRFEYSSRESLHYRDTMNNAKTVLELARAYENLTYVPYLEKDDVLLARIANAAVECEYVHLAGVCSGPGICDTSPLGPKDLWNTKGAKLPNYIRAVAKALMRGGMPKSRAIATSVATMKRWAAGGGKVNAGTKARAVKALAEWEAQKVKAHASK